MQGNSVPWLQSSEPWHKFKRERSRSQQNNTIAIAMQEDRTWRWLDQQAGLSTKKPGLALCSAHPPLLSIKTALWPYIQKPAWEDSSRRICWFIRGQPRWAGSWGTAFSGWQLCSALGPLQGSLREAGQKCFDALLALSEYMLQGPLAGAWMVSLRVRSPAEGMGQGHFLHPRPHSS